MVTNLVLGGGEVGGAIAKILGGEIHDPRKKLSVVRQKVRYMHVCFPYSNNFEKVVKNYMFEYCPEITIVHSSVPIGTCDRLGVCHSPIRGVHPNLVKGIRTFVKYFGGIKAKEAAGIFERFKIKCIVLPDARTSEALKLWETTQYGLLIAINKKIYRWCKKNGIDFDIIYTQSNRTYNDGYAKLGRFEVMRPYLKYMSGKIGGHCVIPNSKLLDMNIYNMLNKLR